MEKKFKSPRGGMIVFLCVVVTALWLTAVYGTYEDSQREKYEVRIKPGAVSYGTHSSVTMPATVSPTHRSSMPMVSGNAVRSYAHYGHASMPSTASSGKGLYATSSATVHTVGAGSGGGAGMGTASGTSSSSRGITYGGGSVSMPTLAVVSSSFASSSSLSEATISSSARYGIGPRRVKDNGDGEYDGEYNSSTGKWWSDEEEDWVKDPFEGCVKYEGGVLYTYQGGVWIKVENQTDPTNPTPLGPAPWLMMLLLACAYALYKYYNKYYTHKVYINI